MASGIDESGRVQSKGMLTDEEMRRLQESVDRRRREREQAIGKLSLKSDFSAEDMKRFQEAADRGRREYEQRMKLEASLRRKEEKARQKKLRSQLLQFKRVREASLGESKRSE